MILKASWEKGSDLLDVKWEVDLIWSEDRNAPYKVLHEVFLFEIEKNV